MDYKIQNKSDFKTGAELVVQIPEEELDYTAMYTMLADRPDFILPFRYRIVDGQAELTYQIERRSKLAYLSGTRSPAEYAEMWSNLLQPLLDCDNWFMKPYCFVLQADYLYCDKATMSISYVYIPSLKLCSNQDLLKTMITDVARLNHVTDINLENKVIWAVQDFDIQDFLQIVRPFRTGNGTEPGLPQPMTGAAPLEAAALAGQTAPAAAAVSSVCAPSEPLNQGYGGKPAQPEPKFAAQAGIAVQRPFDDISIQLQDGGGKQRKERKPKKVKEPKPAKKGNGKNQEIIQGAAAQPVYPVQPVQQAAGQPGYMYSPPDMEGGVTQLLDQGADGPHFRYVGFGSHPAVISVSTQAGGVFTIGRFDVSIGVQQSTFEFEPATKAVSRRHAAVEVGPAGYSIVDLGSSAGTFLNGQKLTPNVPCLLERGCRVSFGNGGADYIWEE